MERKRIAIVTSFTRLGQWRGIMRYGQGAGWICQRHDRDSLEGLAAWKPDGILFQVDEFDTPLLEYMARSPLPCVGLRALHGHERKMPLVLLDLADLGRQIASHFVASNYRRFCYLGPCGDAKANAGNTHVLGMREIARQNHVTLECIHPDHPATWDLLGLDYREMTSTGWTRFWELGPSLISQLEFVLGGNPLVSDSSKQPALALDTTNLTFSFNRADQSEAEITLTVEYGTNLTGWTTIPIGAASLGQVTVTESGAAPDGIVVTIPRSASAGGKLFARLRAKK